MEKYPLSSTTWDHRETDAMARIIASGQFTMGKQVEMFEQKFADYAQSKY